MLTNIVKRIEDDGIPGGSCRPRFSACGEAPGSRSRGPGPRLRILWLDILTSPNGVSSLISRFCRDFESSDSRASMSHSTGFNYSRRAAFFGLDRQLLVSSHSKSKEWPSHYLTLCPPCLRSPGSRYDPRAAFWSPHINGFS